MSAPRIVATAPLLERHYRDFDWKGHVPRDPVQFPHRYERREDIEVVALIAATMAFGRVAAFEPHLAQICEHLGDEPATTLGNAARHPPDSAALAAVRRAAAWQYRWLKPDDLEAMLLGIGRALLEWGSLEAGFVRGMTDQEAGRSDPDLRIWAPLGVFMAALRTHAHAAHRDPDDRARALAFLFPSAEGGAACKRQHMFLRWMVRSPVEGVDFGLWTCLAASELVAPADVHTARIGNALGLCSKPEPSRQVADELTRSLRLLDPEDPVRFDFALAHMGISGGCRASYVPTVCETCGLREACQWWGRI